MSPTSVTISVPARPEYLLLARLALTGVARSAQVNEEALADLRLAVTEAAANACRHAYPGKSGDVTVRFAVDADTMEILVEDSGPGFDSRSVGEWEPDALGDDGMGLAIIRAVADEVEIGSRPGGAGTRVRFTRRLR